MDKDLNNIKVLVLGITFKENCPDIRNTGVVGSINMAKIFCTLPTIYDPWASIADVKNEYDLDIINKNPNEKYDAIILAVAHNEFKYLDIDKLKKLNCDSIVYDVKGILENYTHKL